MVRSTALPLAPTPWYVQNPMTAVVLLERILFARLSGAADAERRTWFERAAAASDPASLALSFAVCSRKLGTAPIALTDAEQRAIEEAGIAWLTTHASLDELARIRLVIASATGDSAARLGEWFRQGDNGEKRAVLRALSLMPQPSLHVEVGATACRSSVQSVFEAICCENPYPAAHFADLAFNQMVLKALFTDVLLERIHGLDARRNAELARMAAGYASERTAAGRSVPADIGRVLAVVASE
jgi:hypothetical protein